MKELGRIQRLFYRDSVSLPEIAKKTGHSRNTVKRWLNTPEGVEPTYRRQHHDNKIAPHAAQLIKALETDAHRPKRDRRSVLKLFDEIKVAGFTGDYSRVTEFIRRLPDGRRSGCDQSLYSARPKSPIFLNFQTPPSLPRYYRAPS